MYGHANLVDKLDGIWVSHLHINQSKVGVRTKNNEINIFDQKKWLEICAKFFEDIEEKMVRNASCFVILLDVNN
jgi:hypothetical protein